MLAASAWGRSVPSLASLVTAQGVTDATLFQVGHQNHASRSSPKCAFYAAGALKPLARCLCSPPKSELPVVFSYGRASCSQLTETVTLLLRVAPNIFL